MSLFSFRANACMHACMNAYIHACMPAFLPQLSRVLFSYVFVHPIPCQFPIYRSILHRKIPLRVNSTLYFLIDLFDENIYIYSTKECNYAKKKRRKRGGGGGGLMRNREERAIERTYRRKERSGGRLCKENQIFFPRGVVQCFCPI